MDQSQHHEKRRTVRHRRSDPIWWRPCFNGDFRIDWLIESSNQGAAFAVRSDQLPNERALVECYLDGAPHPTKTPQVGVVRRITHAHADLSIIAMQILDLRPFPPRPEAMAGARVKPRIEAPKLAA